MRLPAGADEILQARENGRRPADAVIVSCIGPLREANPVVIVTDAKHDWRFLAGLEVYVFVGRRARFVRETLRGLAWHVAENMALWDVDQRRGMNVMPAWDYSLTTFKRTGFSRWSRLTWTDHENRRFDPCA